MFKRGGKKIKGDIQIGENVYPIKWWGVEAHRVEHGVDFVVDPEMPDPDLYTWTENDDGSLNVIARPQPEIDARRAEKIAACYVTIDTEAEAARRRYCPFELQHKEYERTYDAAVAWLADQTQPAPQCVLADVAGTVTALQSAQTIKARGDAMHLALDTIRSTRKAGKLAVAAGTKTSDQVVAELKVL